MKSAIQVFAAAIALAVLTTAPLLAANTPTTAPGHLKANTQGANTTLAHAWYGPGWDGGYGYFDPARTPQYNQYPFYNIVGGESFDPLYENDLPDQNESPFNPAAGLTRHHGAGSISMHSRPMALMENKPVQEAPPANVPDAH